MLALGYALAVAISASSMTIDEVTHAECAVLVHQQAISSDEAHDALQIDESRNGPALWENAIAGVAVLVHRKRGWRPSGRWLEAGSRVAPAPSEDGANNGSGDDGLSGRSLFHIAY